MQKLPTSLLQQKPNQSSIQRKETQQSPYQQSLMRKALLIKKQQSIISKLTMRKRKSSLLHPIQSAAIAQAASQLNVTTGATSNTNKLLSQQISQQLINDIYLYNKEGIVSDRRLQPIKYINAELEDNLELEIIFRDICSRQEQQYRNPILKIDTLKEFLLERYDSKIVDKILLAFGFNQVMRFYNFVEKINRFLLTDYLFKMRLCFDIYDCNQDDRICSVDIYKHFKDGLAGECQDYFIKNDIACLSRHINSKIKKNEDKYLSAKQNKEKVIRMQKLFNQFRTNLRSASATIQQKDIQQNDNAYDDSRNPQKLEYKTQRDIYNRINLRKNQNFLSVRDKNNNNSQNSFINRHQRTKSIKNDSPESRGNYNQQTYITSNPYESMNKTFTSLSNAKDKPSKTAGNFFQTQSNFNTIQLQSDYKFTIPSNTQLTINLNKESKENEDIEQTNFPTFVIDHVHRTKSLIAIQKMQKQGGITTAQEMQQYYSNISAKEFDEEDVERLSIREVFDDYTSHQKCTKPDHFIPFEEFVTDIKWEREGYPEILHDILFYMAGYRIMGGDDQNEQLNQQIKQWFKSSNMMSKIKQRHREKRSEGKSITYEQIYVNQNSKHHVYYKNLARQIQRIAPDYEMIEKLKSKQQQFEDAFAIKLK